MSIHEEKTKLVDHFSQLIAFNKEGILSESTDELVKIGKGTNVFNEIPFFLSIQEPLLALNPVDKLLFRCMQSEYFGPGKYFDFSFYLSNSLYHCLIMDYTEQYQKVLDLQQDRNVELIAKENAEIEALKKLPESEKIFIKVDTLLVSFDLKEIHYVEAYGDYIKIHTEDKFYISHTKLRSMEEFLPENDFVKIHRSYIVRIDQIKSVNPQKVQIKDTMLPISLSFKDHFLSRIRKLN